MQCYLRVSNMVVYGMSNWFQSVPFQLLSDTIASTLWG